MLITSIDQSKGFIL